MAATYSGRGDRAAPHVAASQGRANARVATLPETRAVMWADRPDAVRAAIEEFLARPAAC